MIYSRFRLGMWWKIMGAIGNPVNNRNINKTETGMPIIWQYLNLLGCYSILVTPSIETHAAVSAKLEAPQNLIKIPGWIDYAQIHPLALGLGIHRLCSEVIHILKTTRKTPFQSFGSLRRTRLRRLPAQRSKLGFTTLAKRSRYYA